MYYDPFEQARRMQAEMDRFFGNNYAQLPAPACRETTYAPFVDVINGDKEITILADLPGINKEDLTITVKNNVLEISAERKLVADKKDSYVRRERGTTKFYRAMTLPVEVDEAKAKAKFNNGVLEIVLPKATKPKKNQIKIE